ncbi:metallophosphoesterase [Hyperthermus butylicus]|uniref:Phosphoesterase, ICC-like protein n=1 Tax=Hyperthermus butylicus (strain DSM 5456 / JCM 9403 / PLM1-5) TaxID=415426 RepID=A2BJI2_HYPBU|nr:phosphoesterase, ICC-like protein [Hyperthermus butylicus DSM 5456]
MALLEIAPGVEVVGDLPAVYVRRLNALVVADLHLGFEEEAARQGYFIPRVQLLRSLDVVRRGLNETGAEWVIFAGDVKHSFSRLLPSEREELSRLFQFLREERRVRVTVVRGNHDNYLPIVAERYGVEVVKELYQDGILVVHGHRKPEGDYPGRVEVVIMGHEHPSLRLRDRLGFIAKLPAFLVAPYPRLQAALVVLPAVGQYQTGTSVTLSPDTYLSPILREEVDLRKVKPYVLAEELGVLEFPELELLEDLLAEVKL